MSEEAEVAEAPKKKAKRLWVVLALLILGGGGGVAYYLTVIAPQRAAELSGEELPRQALYLELRPAFVVNLSGPDANRFVQAEIDLMAHDQEALDAVKRHMPAIRNNLLLIIGSRRYATLQSREGKEELQEQVLDEINTILAEREGDLAIAEVYFSSFVMQ